MERCGDLPKVTGRAVAQVGINCVSHDCRKVWDRRGLRRSSLIFKKYVSLIYWKASLCVAGGVLTQTPL